MGSSEFPDSRSLRPGDWGLGTGNFLTTRLVTSADPRNHAAPLRRRWEPRGRRIAAGNPHREIQPPPRTRSPS